MQLIVAEDSVLQKNKMATRVNRRKDSKATEAAAHHIEIKEVRAGLHEMAECIMLRPIYRVSWHRKPLDLFGWRFLGKKIRSGKFVKLPPDSITMPHEVALKYGEGVFKQGIEEIAVFMSTSLTDTSLKAIFAIRAGGSWLDLYHWRSSWSDLSLSRLDICCF